MTEGGRSDVPASMDSSQGIVCMMPMQDMAMIQQGQVPNPVDSAPHGIDINNDADMLASAVVGRTNGHLDEARQVLEKSLMLIKTAKSQTQQPTMAAYGKPIMAAEGKPIPDGKEGAGLRALPNEVVEKMGFVKAAEGKPIPTPTMEQLRGMSQTDLDRLVNLSRGLYLIWIKIYLLVKNYVKKQTTPSWVLWQLKHKLVAELCLTKIEKLC